MFFPKSLWIPIFFTFAAFCFGEPRQSQERADGIFEDQFNDLISRAEKYYLNEVMSYSRKLSIRRNWLDDQVNAGAGKFEKEWFIYFFGGMARLSRMTQDAFILVICHEFGHLLGGAPFSVDEIAGEGESDYFAALKCLPTMWEKIPSLEVDHRSCERSLPDEVVALCGSAHKDKINNDVCLRSNCASALFVDVLAHHFNQPTPSFLTPDPTIVESTLTSYPSLQCRLDTFFQASLNNPRPRCWSKQ